MINGGHYCPTANTQTEARHILIDPTARSIYLFDPRSPDPARPRHFPSQYRRLSVIPCASETDTKNRNYLQLARSLPSYSLLHVHGTVPIYSYRCSQFCPHSSTVASVCRLFKICCLVSPSSRDPAVHFFIALQSHRQIQRSRASKAFQRQQRISTLRRDTKTSTQSASRTFCDFQ
jgi:hypothetical protein